MSRGGHLYLLRLALDALVKAQVAVDAARGRIVRAQWTRPRLLDLVAGIAIRVLRRGTLGQQEIRRPLALARRVVAGRAVRARGQMLGVIERQRDALPRVDGDAPLPARSAGGDTRSEQTEHQEDPVRAHRVALRSNTKNTRVSDFVKGLTFSSRTAETRAAGLSL